MKRILPILSLALFSAGPALAETCMTGDPFPFKTQYAIGECPADIQSILDRMNACAHFAGEDAYDAERKAFLDAAMTENKCAALPCDFHDVFLKYEGDLSYTGVMFEYARVVYGDDTNVPECVKGEKQ